MNLSSSTPAKAQVTVAEIATLLSKLVPKDYGWYLNFNESRFGVLIYQYEGDWQFEIEARSLKSLVNKISGEDWIQHRRRAWAETAS